MQDSLVLEPARRVFIRLTSKSELDFLMVTKKIQEITEFSEEDWEFSGLDMFFVRPCILPLLGCMILKSPMYLWVSGTLFINQPYLQLIYEWYSEGFWKMTITDITSVEVCEITCRNYHLTYFVGEVKLMYEMGFESLEKYYERIWK